MQQILNCSSDDSLNSNRWSIIDRQLEYFWHLMVLFDALVNKDHRTENESPLTFSALLNVLVGLLAAKDDITIIASIRIERLNHG